MEPTRTSPRRRDERAVVALEFALIFPLLTLLIFGTMQYGLYFYSVQAGNAAAREAARRAAVGDHAACTDFSSYVTERVGSASFGNPVVVSRSFTKGPENTAPAVQVGDTVSVTVTFDGLDMDIPLVPIVGDATVQVTADSRVEYVPTAAQTCS